MMSALGQAWIWRTYFSCPGCGLGGYQADRHLGWGGSLTRLVCLAAGRESFAEAERLLDGICGCSPSDEAIRRACQAEGAKIAAFRASSPAIGEAFARAAGDIEFRADAAKVNATGGWRDMKVGIFARRLRGEPATAAEWDERNLPAPTTRAAIEPIDDFAPHWVQWADRLGIEDPTTITALGDGAGWIWKAATDQSGKSPQVLDIYHAAEHVCDAGKGLSGEGTAEAATWLEGGARAAARWLGRAVRPDRGDAEEGARTGRARGVGRVDGLLRDAPGPAK